MVVMTIAMLGALIADLTVGAVCLVLMGASVASTRIRSYVRFVPGTIFAMIALAIPALQAVRRYPPRFAWPDFFDWARSPAWIALIMLLGNVLLDRLKIHVSDSQHATLPNHDPDARVDDGYSHSESDR